MTKANLLPSLGAGFSMIGREPLAVILWGLVSLAAALIPMLVYFAVLGPDVMDYYREVFRWTAESGGEGTPPPQPASFGVAGIVQLLQYVAALVSGAIIYSAVFRSVLRPEEKGFARMRITMDEVNVGVVILVLFLLFMALVFVGAIVLAIPMIIIGVAAASSDSAGLGMTLIPVMLLAFLIGMAILFARFFIALPMTFAERRIRIFEAWTFTKGYAGQLTVMAFLQLLIIFGIYVAALLAIGVAVAGSVMGAANDFSDPQALEALFASGEIFQRFAGLIVVVVLVYAILLFIMTPIMLAPWARAYQLIAADRMQDSAELFA